MSELTSSKNLNQPLSEVQAYDPGSFLDSWDFADACDDKYLHENKYLSTFLDASSSKSPKTKNSVLGLPSVVDDLIQSNISKCDDLGICGNDSTDKKSGHKCIEHNVLGSTQTVKNSSNFCSPTKSSHDIFKDKKSLLTNGPVNFTQNPKPGTGSVQLRNGDNDFKNISTFVRAFHKNESQTENSQETQVKTKLRTMWNNVKYGWRVKREVNLKFNSATWLLGRCYHSKTNDDDALQDVAKELKLDLLSRILLTYRINFPKIPGTDLISDSGWGCMLRCGQMMMAQALVCHFLSRDWRVSSQQAAGKHSSYKMILRWFGDSLSEESPLSLHNLVSLGENYGRKAGDWYGPTHAAQVLRDALIQGKIHHPLLQNMCMYVALDGIVFKQDIMDLCSPVSTNLLPLKSFMKEKQLDTELEKRQQLFESLYNTQSTATDRKCENAEAEHFIDPCPSYSEFGPPSFNTAQSNWTSLILFVSVRLGNDKVNPLYIPCLKNLLTYEHCIGIIGGRPKHALYFVGWQDEKLIHMDPHSCQPAVDLEKDDFNVKTYHSSCIRTMSFTEMDPSCAIGFYFKRKEEFLHFMDNFSEITAPMKKNLDYPVFAFAEGKRKDVEQADMVDTFTRSSISHTSSKTDEDDYILL